MRARSAVLCLAAAFSLSACSSYGDYGYGGVAVGYGYYDDDYYGRYAANPYWGWYDGYYYPGSGYYVYDRYRRPVRWNDRHRDYWQSRQAYWRGRGLDRDDRRELRGNWRDFRQDRRADDRAFRQERRDDRAAFRSGQVTREQFRTDRRSDRRAYRQEFRQDRRALRRENRRDRRN